MEATDCTNNVQASSNKKLLRVIDQDVSWLEAADIKDMLSRLTYCRKYIVESAQNIICNTKFPFDKARINSEGKDGKVILLSNEYIKGRDIWFIGDLHADIISLETVIRFIQITQKMSQNRPYYIVFLGDIIDGDLWNTEIVIRFFELIAEAADSICILTGNHDQGLKYDENGKKFSSSVSPAEFSESLNEKLKSDNQLEVIGKIFIELFSKTPRAILFPDGLLAAHGGMPHSDLWNKITRIEDLLNLPACLDDFIWLRVSAMPKKTPNRRTKGCEFGYEDFEEFCTKFNIKRMIRGHDHYPDRFSINYSEIRNQKPVNPINPVITINTMSYQQSRESSCCEMPVIARYVYGEMPEIYRFDLPDDIKEFISLSKKSLSIINT
jgi:UDP-2,3-diacylglucosamine pyrophosphatase LpxH